MFQKLKNGSDWLLIYDTTLVLLRYPWHPLDAGFCAVPGVPAIRANEAFSIPFA